MRIGIDVDGVLGCFFDVYERLVIDTTGENKFPALYPNVLPPCWNWPEHYGYTSEQIKQVWDRIKKSNNFWVTEQPLPGAVELLKSPTLFNNEVYFITDRPGIDPQKQTAFWIRHHGYTPHPAVIISRKGKGCVANALSLDVYIDDKRENVLDVVEKAPETKVVNLKYPYNEGEYPASVIRIDKLEDFIHVLSTVRV